jgi:hypothetical protein
VVFQEGRGQQGDETGLVVVGLSSKFRNKHRNHCVHFALVHVKEMGVDKGRIGLRILGNRDDAIMWRDHGIWDG